jgi:hypothetical protein
VRESATLIVLLCASLTFAQSARPVPPGLHEAQRAEDQARKNEVPPQAQPRGADPAKLQHDAEELASLAQTIPLEVGQTTRGVLPQDLNAKLKKIEKLAKQLRGELTP